MRSRPLSLNLCLRDTGASCDPLPRGGGHHLGYLGAGGAGDYHLACLDFLYRLTFLPTAPATIPPYPAFLGGRSACSTFQCGWPVALMGALRPSKCSDSVLVLTFLTKLAYKTGGPPSILSVGASGGTFLVCLQVIWGGASHYLPALPCTLYRCLGVLGEETTSGRGSGCISCLGGWGWEGCRLPAGDFLPYVPYHISCC